jgi:hypothetical protein
MTMKNASKPSGKGNVGKTNANMLKLGRNRAKIAAQKGGKGA